MEQRLLLVHAHPDDETLTTGGTIARYARAGVHVTVVTCTLGEEGEIIPSELTELGAHAGDQLGGYRAGELRAACAALAVARHDYLGGIGRWRDSGMAGSAAGAHPRALAGGEFAAQVEALRVLLDEVRPQVVIGYDAAGGYGHPDHIRAHEITMAATESAASVQRAFHTVASESPTRHAVERLHQHRDLPFAVPETAELPTVPDGRAHAAIDITADREAKLDAVRAHRTQLRVWPPETREAERVAYALSNGVAVPDPDTECYELARGGPLPEGKILGDLFDGLGGAPFGARTGGEGPGEGP